MKRGEVLDEAKKAVLHDRAGTHGKPENTFRSIAMLWEAYLGVNIDESDVARMMILLKVARSQQNMTYADNYVDIAGYAACGAELAPELD